MEDPSNHSIHQVYHLRRFFLRTILSLFGPLFVLGYYVFICFYYLRHPPVNNIVQPQILEAQYVYYGWFLISILVLDWARTGLANFEATAIMDPRFAPLTLLELMWHQDNNWNNILWWFRGVRNVVLAVVAKARRQPTSQSSPAISTPSGLWGILSSISILLFIAMPLSGLSFELSTVSTYSIEQAPILGPSPAFFNVKGYTGTSQLIRSAWASGRQTSPADASILYAPSGALHVSNTFYDDVIHSKHNNSTIQFFTGPAVQEQAHGTAWGLQTNVTCQKKHQDDLQLIKIYGFDHYDALLPGSGPGNDIVTLHVPINSVNSTLAGRAFKERGMSMTDVSYSLASVATGPWYGRPPYESDEGDPHELIEAYIWQATVPNYTDPVFQQMMSGPDRYTSTTSGPIQTYDHQGNALNVTTTYLGFGVSCKVSSIMGNATLDPRTRTFSSFLAAPALPQANAMYGQYGVQIQAIAALAGYAGIIPEWPQSTENVVDPSTSQSTWLSMHYALSSHPYVNHGEYSSQFPIYPVLTPDDLTLAIYKILGESAIALMASGSQPVWKGTLYGLKNCRYLVTGVVGWPTVLLLLAVWSICTTCTSIWMAFRKRWAPTLSGFELFKFGAQYSHEVAIMEQPEFQHCRDSLGMIPGMVGSLPGNSDHGNLQFIGLSNNHASALKPCVLDRTKAWTSGIRL